MFPAVDTRDAPAVALYLRSIQHELFPHHDGRFLARLFEDVVAMFGGQFGDFQPIDLAYHDLQHTLQATCCMAEILAGRHGAGAVPAIDARQFDLAMVAVLLHDTGYLKTRADHSGTGAKYTYTHVLRSCAVAASYLPTLGVTLAELDTVLGAIRCTGPASKIQRINFHEEIDKLIGCCLATADYLAQMAASDYPDELTILYREFEESDDYLNVPREKRVFQSADDLIRKTPDFWRKLVEPKLRDDYLGVYRFLARPYPDGPNPYLNAVEHNIAIIADRARAPAPAAS